MSPLRFGEEATFWVRYFHDLLAATWGGRKFKLLCKLTEIKGATLLTCDQASKYREEGYDRRLRLYLPGGDLGRGTAV